MTETTETVARRYVHNVFLVDHWAKLIKDLDMDKHRIALCLSSTMGEKYFVASILEEWDNAVRILPEGEDAQPILVFKNCIETVRVVGRPQKRKNDRE